MSHSKEKDEPPPYHDWTVVEDTSLLPPPPGISYDFSTTTNASYDDAAGAHAWTDVNPLWPPKQLSKHEREALSIGFASIVRPSQLLGDILPNKQSPGKWMVRSHPRCKDACLLSNIPLYSPMYSKTGDVTYFEIKVFSTGPEAAIALGYVAPPYPTWRQPGWERASLAVHSDDGHKFVNDSWGGRGFAKPFQTGDTIGLGMRWRARSADAAEPPRYSSYNAPSSQKEVEIFLTRNGFEEAKWDLHEPVDADMDQPGGVYGLEGDRNLHAAVGVFGACEVEVIFSRHNWSVIPRG